MEEQQTVELGKIITIRFIGPSSKPLKISINNKGVQEKNGVVNISAEAPLAKAIINHRAGENIEFESPEERLKVKIVKII